jgi:glutamine amidotransferase
MIAIIDYGMGNLRSVQKALQKLGHEATITSSPKEITAADRVILPGVGAFGAAMTNLSRPTDEGPSLAEAVLDAIGSGRPFLGICLGMQLLLTESEELGRFAGLDAIPGEVLKFDWGRLPLGSNGHEPHTGSASAASTKRERSEHRARSGSAATTERERSDLKIPHMGWNALCPERDAPILRGVKPGSMVYFVHSYYCVPRDPECVLAMTEHGIPFCSVLGRDNIAAVQFHPEKSGEVGLRMLDNFARM